jgi:hypothetical protein
VTGFGASQSGAADTILDAFKSCAAVGRAPCTEPQFLAACDVNPDLGKRATWTATGDAGQSVVRGGGGCDDRARVAQNSGSRTVLCCSIGIGATSSDTGSEGAEFRAYTARRLLKYIEAINSHDSGQIRAFYAPLVVFRGEEKTDVQLTKEAGNWFKGNPDVVQLYGRCQVQRQGDALWKATCPTTIYYPTAPAMKESVYAVVQTLTFQAGDDGKMLSMVEEGDTKKLYPPTQAAPKPPSDEPARPK